MKTSLIIALALSCFSFACRQNSLPGQPLPQSADSTTSDFAALIDPAGMTIESRIRTPRGFERARVAEDSFAAYLRWLPLKPHRAKVLLYNGAIKENHGIYDAVVDLKIGNKNLHQCADAVIRLRAEYLYRQKQWDKIHFNFSNGFRVDYSEWMKGKRVIVKGNATYWVHTRGPACTYKDFWDYLELIFGYAGTLSLAKELQPVNIDDLQIGDVFIQGGSPGHAIIVVDLAVNPQEDKKYFLLAQSYMPAQEIQILKNQSSAEPGPWYAADFGNVLKTPEWTFRLTDLKRFAEL